MRKTYRVEHPGPNNAHTVKRVLTDNYAKFRFPCDVVFVTGNEEKKYYAEESNIRKHGLIVIESENTITPPLDAIYVVVREMRKRPVNVLVTKNFREAFDYFLNNYEEKRVYVEVWKEGELLATCKSIGDFASLGKDDPINVKVV